MSSRFNGKHCVVTGAAGGIGSSVAKQLADEGAKLTLVDLDMSALENLGEKLRTETSISHSHIFLKAADVSKVSEVRDYIDASVENHGPIDCFHNNAAIEGPVSFIEEHSVEDFDRVVAVNIRGVWLGLKFAIPHFASKGGSIVITSSVAGTIGSPGQSAYVTSKTAVIGIMRTACLELAERNIRVNTVHPGMVDTGMARRIAQQTELGEDGFVDWVTATIPLRRYATPNDVSSMVCYLFSDEASYCNGSEFFVDGGIRVGNG